MGLAAVVLAGLCLRTWNLSNHGFSHYDEAHYMMEAKFWRSVIDQRADLTEAFRRGELNAAFIETRIDGIPPSFTPKPFHGFSIALFSLITGLQEEWAGSLWAAILGAAAIGCVGWWTAGRFGAATGLLAAVFLSVSRAHVMYSRSQLAESDAMLFLLAAVLLHMNLVLSRGQNGVKKCVGLGILYGIAVATNYRCLLVAPLVCLWDGLATFSYSRRWPAESLRRFYGILGGLVFVLCLFELPYRIYIWRGGTLPEGMLTYLEGLFAWYLRGQNLPVQGGGLLSLFRPHLRLVEAYLYLEGFWWAGGLILGLWAACRSGSPARWGIAALAFLPLIGFSLVSRGDGPRAVMTSIPFYAILASLGWMELYGRVAEKRGRLMRLATGAGIGVMCLAGLAGSWSETRVFSAWPAAGRWLEAQPKELCHTTFPLAVRYYLGKARADLPPKDDITPGLWVIDRYNAAYAYPYESVKKLRALYKPVQVFEGRVYPQTALFLDWGIFMRRGGWRKQLEVPDMGQIEVYRIER